MESPFQTTPAGELKHLLNCPSPLYALSVDGTKSRGICPYAGDPLFGHVSLGFARGLQPKSLSECVITGACPNQIKKKLTKAPMELCFFNSSGGRRRCVGGDARERYDCRYGPLWPGDKLSVAAIGVTYIGYVV